MSCRKLKGMVASRLKQVGCGEFCNAAGTLRAAIWPIRLKDATDIELYGANLGKGGRLVFEVAVEWSERARTWSEMIRLWVSGHMDGSSDAGDQPHSFFFCAEVQCGSST